MLASVAIAPLNHMLRGESWARKRLQPCAGKTARFRVPPFFDLAVAIQPTGEVAAASTAAGNDTILTIMPALLPRLLVRDEAAYREIRISGDSVFGQEILEIGQNLHWDVEQDLSDVMGDILAHRVVRAGESMVHWHNETLHNLSQALMEYLTEEQPVLAKPTDMRTFAAEVSGLQDHVSKLELRVEDLINQSL
jgi:ubiquinone biosynthesis accessory factor UbiJ